MYVLEAKNDLLSCNFGSEIPKGWVLYCMSDLRCFDELTTSLEMCVAVLNTEPLPTHACHHSSSPPTSVTLSYSLTPSLISSSLPLSLTDPPTQLINHTHTHTSHHITHTHTHWTVTVGVLVTVKIANTGFEHSPYPRAQHTLILAPTIPLVFYSLQPYPSPFTCSHPTPCLLLTGHSPNPTLAFYSLQPYPSPFTHWAFWAPV